MWFWQKQQEHQLLPIQKYQKSMLLFVLSWHIQPVYLSVFFFMVCSSSFNLVHHNKSVAFTFLCTSFFQDAESLVQGHWRLLLERGEIKGDMSAHPVNFGFPKSSDPVVRRFFDFVTYRFANTVDVKLERHSFRSFLFGRFHVTCGQAGRRGMQSPGRRRPTESKQVQKVSFLLRVTFCSCPGSLTQAESWLWGCRWRHSKLRCYL